MTFKQEIVLAILNNRNFDTSDMKYVNETADMIVAMCNTDHASTNYVALDGTVYGGVLTERDREVLAAFERCIANFHRGMRKSEWMQACQNVCGRRAWETSCANLLLAGEVVKVGGRFMRANIGTP